MILLFAQLRDIKLYMGFGRPLNAQCHTLQACSAGHDKLVYVMVAVYMYVGSFPVMWVYVHVIAVVFSLCIAEMQGTRATFW